MTLREAAEVVVAARDALAIAQSPAERSRLTGEVYEGIELLEAALATARASAGPTVCVRIAVVVDDEGLYGATSSPLHVPPDVVRKGALFDLEETGGNPARATMCLVTADVPLIGPTVAGEVVE